MAFEKQFAGFLTGMFRNIFQRPLPAFSGLPNGPLSRKRRGLHAYSTAGRPAVFRFSTGFPFRHLRVRVSHRVAHLPQNKPDSMFTPIDSVVFSVPQCRRSVISGIVEVVMELSKWAI